MRRISSALVSPSCLTAGVARSSRDVLTASVSQLTASADRPVSTLMSSSRARSFADALVSSKKILAESGLKRTNRCSLCQLRQNGYAIGIRGTYIPSSFWAWREVRYREVSAQAIEDGGSGGSGGTYGGSGYRARAGSSRRYSQIVSTGERLLSPGPILTSVDTTE